MSYAGNNEIIRKHFHDYQENLCIAVLSIIPLCKTFFLMKVIFTQGTFKNIQGLLWKIQGLFKDILHFKVKKGLRPIWYGEGRRHLATLLLAWPLCRLNCSLRSLRNLWGWLVTSLRISHNFSIFKNYSRPVRTIWQLYSLKMNILQCCQLYWIIPDTPDFEPFLPVSRLESEISRIVAEVCYFL